MASTEHVLPMEIVIGQVQPHCRGDFQQNPKGNETRLVKMLKVTKPKYGKVPQHTHPNDNQPIDLNLA